MDVTGAVDIGGTKIAVGMVTPQGDVLASLEIATQPELGLEAGIRRIAEALEMSLTRCGGKLLGVGIGCTGQIDQPDGAIRKNQFLPGWEGTGLLHGLSDYFSTRVVIENDAVAAALAAAAWGPARGKRTLVFVTISTGIGGAVIVDGQVYRGAGGAHPEIGHHIIDPSGPLCFCGAYGCWESLASGTAMAAWAAAANPISASKLNSAAAICAAAESGDRFAKQVVEREGYYLGIGLANLVTIFSPDAVVLSGGVMRSYALFTEAIQKQIHSACRLVPSDQVSIFHSLPDDHNALLGAAQVWLAYNR
jgi:glucokinase